MSTQGILGKVCSACKHWWPYERFYYERRSKDGRASRCMTCNYKQVTKWKKSHPTAVRKVNQRHQKDYAERRRELKRFRLYGVTPEDFSALKSRQKNKCGICCALLTACAHVDHDHSSKKVRGLLCHRCNLGLGHFKDSVGLLSKAINYLNEH